MRDIEALHKSLNAMNDLEGLTDMLEQTAARTISIMQQDILSSRPYFQQIWRIYGILKQLAPPPPEITHKHLIVMIGIDWGMTGSLMNRVIEEAKRLQNEHDADILIAGKMAKAHFKDTDGRTMHYFSCPKNISLELMQPIYKVVSGYSHVTMVYPSFDSLSKQSVCTASFSVKDSIKVSNQQINPNDIITVEDAKTYIVDPDPQSLVNYINEAVVGLTIHHYFAESSLAYSAAQMIAMRNGHDNAENEAKKIKLLYNKARRDVIDAKLRELFGSRLAIKEKD